MAFENGIEYSMDFCNYIYRDPKTQVVRYVGWGSTLDRPVSHLRKSCNSKLHYMLQKRIREGYDPQPEITICTHQSENYAKLIECCWIEKYGREDMGKGTLFNGTDGGDGRVGWSEEQRAAMGDVHRGKIESDETRRKKSISHMGDKNSMFGKERPDLAELNRSRRGMTLSDGAKSKLRRQVTCPHCGFICNVSNATRYHLDNCKFKDGVESSTPET